MSSRGKVTDMVSWMLLYPDSNGVVHFIFARLKILFLQKFGPKNQYCQFNDDAHFSCFWQEITSLKKFGQEIQNFLFIMKFDT